MWVAQQGRGVEGGRSAAAVGQGRGPAHVECGDSCTRQWDGEDWAGVLASAAGGRLALGRAGADFRPRRGSGRHRADA